MNNEKLERMAFLTAELRKLIADLVYNERAIVRHLGGYCSPVDPQSRDAVPSNWYVAIPHGAKYTRAMDVPDSFIGQYHPGVDLNRRGEGERGAPVYAIANGECTFAGVGTGTWGNIVVIRHDDDGSVNHFVTSRSAHLNKINVRRGQRVVKGQVIGGVGGAFGRFEPHLHFELSKTERFIQFPSIWDGRNKAALDKHYLEPVSFIQARL